MCCTDRCSCHGTLATVSRLSLSLSPLGTGTMRIWPVKLVYIYYDGLQKKELLQVGIHSIRIMNIQIIYGFMIIEH